MKGPALDASRPRKKRYVVAMVLGTALSALGAPAQASEDPALRSVSDISRYCTACWRNARLHPDSWTDCTQEVFCRLMERVSPETWACLLKADGEERREFLRAIDTVKKRFQRGRTPALAYFEALADTRALNEGRLRDEREAVRQAAGQLLTPRQQRILLMSLEGWSVQEIAGHLSLPPDRVSDEKYKAIRKLRERLKPAEGG